MTSPETGADSEDAGPIQAIRPDADLSRGHLLSFVGIFLFTFIVYSRPYEWSPSLMWLTTSAFWVAVSTVLVFVPSQLSLGNRLTIPEPEVKLALLLLVAGFLSVPFATDPSLAWKQFVDYSKVVVVFIMTVNVLRTERRLRVLLLLILSVTAVLGVSAVADYASGNFTLRGVRIEGAIGGLFSNPNDLALQFVTMAPIAIVLFKDSRNVFLKVLYFGVALATIAGVLATFSRGGLLGLVSALALLAWRVARGNRGLLMIGLLAFLIFAPMIAGYSSRFSTTEASAVARTDNLRRSIFVALRNPVFGIGMNNFVIYSNSAHVTHNAYTQVWVEMGIGAFFLYVAFLVIPLKRLRRIGNSAVETGQGGAVLMSKGLEASLCGYMVASFFASVAYLWYVYYLVAFAICLRRLHPVALSTTGDHDPECECSSCQTRQHAADSGAVVISEPMDKDPS